MQFSVFVFIKDLEMLALKSEGTRQTFWLKAQALLTS